MYYRNAHCAIVVYDITQPDTLENAKGWIRELRRHADANILITLVGNKLDLDGRREVVAGVDDRVDRLAGLLSDFVTDGGKRMRPRFALAGWTAAAADGAAVPDEVVTACAALELIQACALVHDDIVDASDTRRGRPTVHRTAEAAQQVAQVGEATLATAERGGAAMGELAQTMQGIDRSGQLGCSAFY